jgi:multisubunit Na+/H+ antiporter MnhG subunit
VVASVAAVVPRDLLDRLHVLAPVTSLGVPLIGVGLAVDTGWHLATALILLTVAVVAATGPVLAAATARADAEQRDLIPAESPE